MNPNLPPDLSDPLMLDGAKAFCALYISKHYAHIDMLTISAADAIKLVFPPVDEGAERYSFTRPLPRNRIKWMEEWTVAQALMRESLNETKHTT